MAREICSADGVAEDSFEEVCNMRFRSASGYGSVRTDMTANLLKSVAMASVSPADDVPRKDAGDDDDDGRFAATRNPTGAVNEKRSDDTTLAGAGCTGGGRAKDGDGDSRLDETYIDARREDRRE